MTRRRPLLGVCLLAATGVAAVVGWWAVSVPAGVNRLSYLRIHHGMRREQVEAILGGPEGDYQTDGKNRAHCEGGLHQIGRRLAFWYGDDGDVLITFDQDRRVSRSEWRPRHPTAMDKMLRWLDW
jgi:hypothetical protein